MNNEKVNIEANGVKHASTCFIPTAWPPPWLAVSVGLPPAVALPPVAVGPSPEVSPVVVQAAGDGCGLEEIEPPAPCPTCGSLELWQDLRGGWHCQHCEAAKFRRSQQVAERAARLRRLRARLVSNQNPPAIIPAKSATGGRGVAQTVAASPQNIPQ